MPLSQLDTTMRNPSVGTGTSKPDRTMDTRTCRDSWVRSSCAGGASNEARSSVTLVAAGSMDNAAGATGTESCGDHTHTATLVNACHGWTPTHTKHTLTYHPTPLRRVVSQ